MEAGEEDVKTGATRRLSERRCSTGLSSAWLGAGRRGGNSRDRGRSYTSAASEWGCSIGVVVDLAESETSERANGSKPDGRVALEVSEYDEKLAVRGAEVRPNRIR